jgi:hypothetical protein
VDDLEVVEVAVGLVEVAVVVVVVPVLDVVLGERRPDLGGGRAGRELVLVPGGDAVADGVPDGAAGAGAAGVVAVAGLVVGHPHPVGDHAVDRVAA